MSIFDEVAESTQVFANFGVREDTKWKRLNSSKLNNKYNNNDCNFTYIPLYSDLKMPKQ